MRSWKESIINSNKRVAIPIMTHPGIELLGKTIIEAVSDGNVHFEAVKALDQKYPAAACTAIMDLTVEAEAFGAKVNFIENDIPSIIENLLSDKKSVEKLQIPDLKSSRIPQFILANKLTAEYSKNKPVFGGIIGPFSLAGRLYGLSEFMLECYVEPKTANLLLNKCTEFLIAYCQELKKQGSNGIIIAEPSAGLLSNDGCSEFSSVYIKKIIEIVQDDNFMVILHNCGNTGHCTEAMLKTGAMGYHFGNKIDMLEALNNCPSDVLVMGNIDPVSILKSATPETVKICVTELLNKTSIYQNFVLSTGCDVSPNTPVENIEEFYRALDCYLC